MIKLDIGCGPNKKEGFVGVDSIAFPNVDIVLDATLMPWPWEDGSVSEIQTSHYIEHLTAQQRVDFMNEAYRVLAPKGVVTVVCPHWGSCRAYGDPTHQWPPVSEFWFFYLSKDWRNKNAPHTDADHIPNGFSCNFGATWGYGLREDLMLRNEEYRMFAVANYKEVCQDIVGTLTKKEPNEL